MQLLDRVLRTIQRRNMMRRGAHVLAALSGGPDSVALVHLLRELEQRGELSLCVIAHLNHALRPAADEDEAFCRALAASLAIPITIERVDVRALAKERRTSLEDAGRTARYAFFERAAAERDAGVIATGHTRDDQAETFLLRLIRGAGPRGLAGILPVAGRVVRPLIEIGRDEIRAYLAERNLPYRNDESNLDVSIPRNRVRHELIPYLQREFSPGVVNVLAREADIAREDEDRLRREAIDSLDGIVLKRVADADATDRDSIGAQPDPTDELARLEFDAEALTSLHPALAARVARLALGRASKRFIGFEHVQRFLEFARDAKPSAELTLPGCRAIRRSRRIVFAGRAPAPFSNSFEFRLSIPGEVTLHASGWTISAEPLDAEAWAADTWNGRGSAAAVQSRSLRLPLTVRSRRRGDRFRPIGLRVGRKKLQDFLVDRKVARERRDSLPLVVDSEDRIVWVVGEALAEDFRVTEPSQGVILLKVRRLGGQG